jgi:hypothetical protein
LHADAFHDIDDDNGAITQLHGGRHLACKVYVSGGVDEMKQIRDRTQVICTMEE